MKHESNKFWPHQIMRKLTINVKCTRSITRYLVPDHIRNYLLEWRTVEYGQTYNIIYLRCYHARLIPSLGGPIFLNPFFYCFIPSCRSHKFRSNSLSIRHGHLPLFHKDQFITKYCFLNSCAMKYWPS